MKLRCLSLSAFEWWHSALVWVIASTAHGDVLGWLDFNGQIRGESLQTSHLNWIEIQGFSIEGKLHENQPGKLGFTKLLDRASPSLYLACAKGSRYAKATLDLNFPSANAGQAGQAGQASPVRIEMEDLFVSSNSISSGGDRPTENFELVFGRIVYTYVTDPRKSETINYDFRSRTGSVGAGNNPDADGDGLPDAWETTYGFSIGKNDAAGDADGDGLTNLQEYQLGTDPKSATSFFRATLTPASNAPGSYQLSWNSVVGKIYIIEWSPDLITPFVPIRTVTASATTSTESIANSGNVGFYRVRPQ